MGHNDLPTKRNLRSVLVWDYFLRFHMILIVLLSFCSGLLMTKLLLALGIEIIWCRYLFSMLIAYLVFLLGIRLWLTYTGYSRYLQKNNDAPSSDFPDTAGIDGYSSSLSPTFTAKGGEFGGGGASSSFDAASVNLPSVDGMDALEADSLDGIGDVLSSEVSAFVLILVVVIVLSVLSGTAYIVYQAPNIFTEVVFEAILADRLLRISKQADSIGWIHGAIKVTWKPFLWLLVSAVFFGWLAQRLYPEAHTIADVGHHLIN